MRFIYFNSSGYVTSALFVWGYLIGSYLFLQFCLYGSRDSLGPEFMHPKLKLCIQPGTRGEIFCCVQDFSFKLV